MREDQIEVRDRSQGERALEKRFRASRRRRGKEKTVSLRDFERREEEEKRRRQCRSFAAARV
jgi:hypothetical protein